MDRINWNRFLKTLLKFTVSGIALYIVFRNIDWNVTRKVLLSADLLYLLIATIFFIGSKVFSAFRLNRFFAAIHLSLTDLYNLRLYWIGMFYNLFLPGGIGGDGYKVYLLNKKYKVSVKPLISATLLDRISGLFALIVLAFAGYLLLPEAPYYKIIRYLSYLCIFLGFPAFVFFVRIFFREFKKHVQVTTLQSFVVQGLQIVCAYFILISLGVEDKFIAYKVLFLISSVVAVFPFTIGGVGARELTFILGYQYLGISENVSVAFSLLFFLITAAVSLIGGFLREGD